MSTLLIVIFSCWLWTGFIFWTTSMIYDKFETVTIAILGLAMALVLGPALLVMVLLSKVVVTKDG